ncbi:PREDICTED: uncharacterized protein LOC108365255 [Rhagoletis zephyria]|uniref:uncharacterized protein LOC108365255 n=1 Tax=Rhagoletis zephyria TaxID=28612 RepID=UPI0008119085|nr:PREDICTED: uncharacterized protein LOC108365255 [Rhagoletis zephyria]
MFKEVFTITTNEYRYSERQSTLEDRFGRPEQLVKSQIGKIQDVAPIHENLIKRIVPFATKVQNLASFLESANCDHHLANPTLMDELLAKLPMQKRIDWSRHALTIVPRPKIRHFSD